MTEISELIDRLRRDWSNPREAVHGDSPCPFALHCEFDGPASAKEIEAINDAPEQVMDFWRRARNATLFKDGQYGQWGLRILDPATSLERTIAYERERAEEAVPGDLVIGIFLGDSELLIVRRDVTASDYGSVSVALPLYPRSDWDIVAESFEEFLRQYSDHEGSKFWERY